MLSKVFEPERVPSYENRAYIIACVVAAKTELAAAKLYAGLVRLKADSERLPTHHAEEIVTHDLVTMSGSIARLMNENPNRPYLGHMVDFAKVAGDIQLRFSPVNTIYREAKPMLGL